MSCRKVWTVAILVVVLEWTATTVPGHLAAVVALPSLGLLVQLTAAARGPGTGPARVPAPAPVGLEEPQR